MVRETFRLHGVKNNFSKENNSRFSSGCLMHVSHHRYNLRINQLSQSFPCMLSIKVSVFYCGKSVKNLVAIRLG